MLIIPQKSILLDRVSNSFMCGLTLGLSGGVAVRLDEWLGVTDWPKPVRTRFAQRKNYTMVAMPAKRFTSHATARAVYVAARLLKIDEICISVSPWA
jgi:hypothetical protein